MKRKKKLKIITTLIILFASYITINLFYNETLIGKIAEGSLIVLIGFNLVLLLFKKG